MSRIIIPDGSFSFAGYDFHGQNWNAEWTMNTVPFITDSSKGYGDATNTLKGLSFTANGVISNAADTTHPYDLIGNPYGNVVCGDTNIDVDSFDANIDFHTIVFATENSSGWQEATVTYVTCNGNFTGIVVDSGNPVGGSSGANTIYDDNDLTFGSGVACTLTAIDDGTNKLIIALPFVNLSRVSTSVPSAGFRRVTYNYVSRGPFTMTVATIGDPFNNSLFSVSNTISPTDFNGDVELDISTASGMAWYFTGVPASINLTRPFGPGAITTYSITGYSTGSIDDDTTDDTTGE